MKKKEWDISKIIAIVSPFIVFLSSLMSYMVRTDTHQMVGASTTWITLFLSIIFSLLLFFGVNKSIGFSAWLIGLGLIFVPLISAAAFLPLILGGSMALINCIFAQKEENLISSEADSGAIAACRNEKKKLQTFVFVTLFFLMPNSFGSSSLLSLALLILGNIEFLSFAPTATMISSISSAMHLVALPVYLLYFGAQHPFSEKENKPMIVVGSVLTVLFCVPYAFLALREGIGFVLPLILLIRLPIVFFGYFWLCKKWQSPYTYALVSVCTVILPPYVLLAAIAVVVALVALLGIKLFFGGANKSSPSPSKSWEVTENGVTYTITENANGRYFDDTNKEWATDDGGSSFYRI